MPNYDACIICNIAETLQTSVRIVGSDVHFLHNKGHFIITQKANGQKRKP